jgi:hypothetical protein
MSWGFSSPLTNLNQKGKRQFDFAGMVWKGRLLEPLPSEAKGFDSLELPNLSFAKALRFSDYFDG